MMQPLDGSQPEDRAAGGDFLSDYVNEAIASLKKHRDPDSFQQVVNGARPQTLDANSDYYV